MSLKIFKRLLQEVHDGHDDHSDDEQLGHDDHSDDEHLGYDDHSDDEDHLGHDDHEDHAAEAETEGGMSVENFKIILLFCMLLCVSFGLLPKLLGNRCRSDQMLSLLNCFSAGIFLGMALIHMMPESAEIYAIWAKDQDIERPFPLPYVMFFVGYLFILSIDRVAAKAYHTGHDHGDEVPKPVGADMMGASVVKPKRDSRVDPGNGVEMGNVISFNVTDQDYNSPVKTERNMLG